MFYVKWTIEDISNLSNTGIAELITEIDEDGSVQREIGIDDNNKIVHKYPSSGYPCGERGLFDLQSISTVDLKSNTTKDTFEQLWVNETFR